jgi:5'-methylthioadenosine phosphorylase
VWHESADDVTVEMVMHNLSKNAAHGKAIVSATIAALPSEQACACGSALENAIVTAPELVPQSTRRRLDAIVSKYWGDAP